MDRTREFQEICQSRASTSKSTINPATAEALRKRRKRKRESQTSQSTLQNVDINDPDVDVWTLEAKRVAASLGQLSLFLSSIRRAYLDLASTNHIGKGKASSRNGVAGRGELDLSKGLLEAWKDVKWLDDQERDEVDWQAKTILRRCMERVRELQTAESNRHNRAMQQLNRLPTNSLTKMLGLPLVQATDVLAAEEALNAHRNQVTLYLSRLLADVGKTQQDQQEQRVKRQLERQALNTAAAPRFDSQPNKAASGSKASNAVTHIPAPQLTGGDDDDDEAIESMLTADQIQQFESESSQLLQEANTQLAAIEKAQSSLLEISNLQSELAVHLTQQMELTDQLWEDSVLVTGRVDEGNKQLKQARERNREGRLWLLVFLIGASFSLLFLEFY